MSIQRKQKSKNQRVTRRATSNTLEQMVVTPALLPEIAAPDRSTAEAKVADSALPTNSDHQPVEIGKCKIGENTHVTLVGDMKSILRDFGTEDPDFLNGFIDQLANASARGSLYLEEIGLNSWDERQYPDELGIKFMLAFVKRNKPADEIEATLLAQMASTHVAMMKFANRLAHATTLAERDSAERTYNKLARTFAVEVDALQRYRSKAENKVVFQHVSVGDGGQAIVGNITRPAQRRALKKRARVAPLIADARQVPMEIIGDPQRRKLRK